MKTAQDSYTITVKEYVKFQEKMHPIAERIWLDQIQNGRLSASIYFHMPAIW